MWWWVEWEGSEWWWEEEGLRAASEPLAGLLLRFFEFWTRFDFSSRCCSVRLGRPCRVGESPMGQTASPRTFACEDPIEPDENTARTLAAAHLQELRGELQRQGLRADRAGGHRLGGECKQNTGATAGSSDRRSAC